MNWIKIPVSFNLDNLKQEAEELRSNLKSFAFNPEHVYNIDPSIIKSTAIGLTDKKLDRLRVLCQLCNSEIKYDRFTSHRKFIGPFIVLAKKIIFLAIKLFLREYVEHQQRFNQAVVLAYAEQFEDPEQK